MRFKTLFLTLFLVSCGNPSVLAPRRTLTVLEPTTPTLGDIPGFLESLSDQFVHAAPDLPSLVFEGMPASPSWGRPASMTSNTLLICGKEDGPCSGDSRRATQLRYGINQASLAFVRGPDADLSDLNSWGGSSFTIITRVRRVGWTTPSTSQFILLDKDGYAHASGVALGFTNAETLHFGTQGKNGANTLTFALPLSTTNAFDSIIARFSRTEGLTVFVNHLRADAPTKTKGSDIRAQNTKILTLGSKVGTGTLELSEFATFDRALSDEEVSEVFELLNLL